ncbi:MAG: sugar phosphate isomerase/epimerase [Isosphaeraceae bacterium]|nr:sugar phosphate isomerase/epimerase [Isosphaeraceae bacterium]
MIDDRSLLTRRGALAAGLALAGSACVARSAFSALAEDKPYGPFKAGIQSYSLRGYGFADALAKSKELGLHYWESYRDHIKPEVAAVPAAKAKAADFGVEVIGFGVQRFTKDHDANRKMFEFAQAMGLGYLSADPDPDSFDSLDKLVDEFKIAVGIHNHGPGHRYGPIDVIAKAIRDHHELIGVCNDTGHFLRSKEDPVRAVEVFGKRTYGVHLKDVKDAVHFTILGEGDLRLVELLAALKKIGYSYCLALEYEENPKNPIADIAACLTAFRSAVAKI